MIKSPQTKKGFTLVETLVAIMVLMITIAGAFVVTNQGLLVAVGTRNQMTAYFLAQDAMEYIKNIRDTNRSNGVNWLSMIDNCLSGTPCKVSSMRLPSNDGIQSCPSVNGCDVYIDATGYQQRDVTSQKTLFGRMFFLENTTNPRERKVVVVVSWKELAVPYEIRLVNYIFDISL